MASETEEPLYMATTSDEDKKVLSMVMGDDEEIFGRMSVGGAGDVSEFDPLPIDRLWTKGLNPSDEVDQKAALRDGYVTDDVEGDYTTPPPFVSPADEHFPVFMSELRRAESSQVEPRIARIDTEETYGDFVCERAVREIARRLSELRATVEQHVSDHHGPSLVPMRKWDEVLGAAQTIADMRSSETADEAVSKMPDVPLDLPDFTEGKVRAWRDGDAVVVSIRFMTDGGGRIATMAARPRTDADEVAGWAIRAGADPVTVLGALPELAASAVGKRLARDVAGAALRASEREDVCCMGCEPVVLGTGGDMDSAPLAALVRLMKRASGGDQQAAVELARIRTASRTATGQKVAGPLLAAAERQFNETRSEVLGARTKQTLMQRYLGWA